MREVNDAFIQRKFRFSGDNERNQFRLYRNHAQVLEANRSGDSLSD
jgi:hypothetical protein